MTKYYQLNAFLRNEGDWGIVSNNAGNLISVNEMGVEVLKILFNDNCTFDEIITQLMEKYIFSPEDSCVTNAVDDFLTDMIEEGIVEITDTRNHHTDVSKCYVEAPEGQDKSTLVKSPLNAIVLLTNKCNQKCNFCYIDPKFQCPQPEFSIEELTSLCDTLIKQNVLTLNILGGEPLARFDELVYILNYMKVNHPWCHVSFATNGTYGGGISKDKALVLSKFENLSIRISLHGLFENHDKIVGLSGAFDTAMRSIDMLHEYAPELRISINATMNAYLIKFYKEFIDELFCNHPIDNIEFAPMQYVGHANLNKLFDGNLKTAEGQALKELKKLRKHWLARGKVILYGGRYNPDLQIFSLKDTPITCGIQTQIIIDTNGDCYYCHMTTGMKEFCGGNIFKDCFESIWNSPIHKHLVSALDAHTQACEKCEQFSTCQGGCKMSTYLNYGTFDGGIDPSCPHCLQKTIF